MIKICPVNNGENLEQVRILWCQFAEFLKGRFHERAELPDFKEYFPAGQSYSYNAWPA